MAEAEAWSSAVEGEPSPSTPSTEPRRNGAPPHDARALDEEVERYFCERLLHTHSRRLLTLFRSCPGGEDDAVVGTILDHSVFGERWVRRCLDMHGQSCPEGSLVGMLPRSLVLEMVRDLVPAGLDWLPPSDELMASPAFRRSLPIIAMTRGYVAFGKIEF